MAPIHDATKDQRHATSCIVYYGLYPATFGVRTSVLISGVSLFQKVLKHSIWDSKSCPITLFIEVVRILIREIPL